MGAGVLADTGHVAHKSRFLTNLGAVDRVHEKGLSQMDAHQKSPVCPNRRPQHPLAGTSVVLDANGASDPQEIPPHLHALRARGRRAGRPDGGARRDSRVGLKPWTRRADKMKVGDLAIPGTSSRFGRCDHDRHAADRGDVELEALATAQPRSVYHLHFGQLVVPVADAVDGLGSKPDSAPEFTNSELCGGRHVTKYIAPGVETVTGVDR